MKPGFSAEKAKSAVLTVGDGRGFVIKSRGYRKVVTVAHCLPFFPPCHGASYLSERTFEKLLSPLGKTGVVWTECLFADPIADLAVLGSPDSQELYDEAEAYEKLVDSVSPFRIEDVPPKGHAWLLSLKGEWFECDFEVINDGPLLIKPSQSIDGGMSGSPILSDTGAAIGIVNLASAISPEGTSPNSWLEPSLNARLLRDLPVRFLRPKRLPLPPLPLHAE
jgi:hypothetical protein